MIEGWELRLSGYLRESRKKKFVWGEHDCILFSAKAYEAITGIDFYTKYLPYSTKKEAMDILSYHGGMEGIISENLGAGNSQVKKASRGCPILLKERYLMCGIVSDDGASIAIPGNNGLSFRPLTDGIMFWRF